MPNREDISWIYPILWIVVIAGFCFLVYVIYKYVKDLKSSPREI